MRLTGVLTGVLVAIGLTAFAADPETAKPAPLPFPILDALDDDGDGVLSPEEIRRADEGLRNKDFDGDGVLTKKELSMGTRFHGGNRIAILKGFQAIDVDFDGEVCDEERLDAPDALLRLDVDGDGRLSLEEIVPDYELDKFERQARPENGWLEPGELIPEYGAETMPDLEAFDRLSYKGNEVYFDFELAGRKFVKFVLFRNAPGPSKMYFMNTKSFRGHGAFMSATGIPKIRGSADGKICMRGTLIHEPRLTGPDGSLGLYTFEFNPGNKYPADEVLTARESIERLAPFTGGRLAYIVMPAARDLYEQEKLRYLEAGLPALFSGELNQDLTFLALHPGEGYGRLRWMEPNVRPETSDIVLCRSLPNEMPRVAGVLTAVMQTPLSHVNLRAVQDNIPNAYLRDADVLPNIRALIGQWVHFKVTPDGYSLREADPEKSHLHIMASRPRANRIPDRDLFVREIRSLANIGFEDSRIFGVKTANLAAMRRMDLPSKTVPDGYGVPFSFYDAFMQHNEFYEEAQQLMDASRFQADAEWRKEALARFRKRIRKGDVPGWMSEAIMALQASFPAGVSIRCRSSTNAEDLPNFSGAGLYDSYTHRPDEGALASTLRQVYASLWNYRAYEERAHHGVDHLTTAMGVLVHPNFSGERANGVAVTDDVTRSVNDFLRWRFYVNTQVGEDLVTNPEEGSIPEERLLHPRKPGRDELVRASNRVPQERGILTEEQTEILRRCLRTIHRQFRGLYGKTARDNFAMEIEFKVDAHGDMVVKQARPWVY